MIENLVDDPGAHWDIRLYRAVFLEEVRYLKQSKEEPLFLGPLGEKLLHKGGMDSLDDFLDGVAQVGHAEGIIGGFRHFPTLGFQTILAEIEKRNSNRPLAMYQLGIRVFASLIQWAENGRTGPFEGIQSGCA